MRSPPRPAARWLPTLPDRRRAARAGCAALLVCVAVHVAPAAGQLIPPVRSDAFKSDWEEANEARNWREQDYSLPAYPKEENLIEFFVSAASCFRFFVDADSLSVTDDGVVRYTLVARSEGGAENVSFEGIRCSAGTYRIYATGHRGGTWSPRPTEWRPIDPKSVARWHQALRREYFCPKGMRLQSAAEGVEALRNGRHPASRNRAFD